MVVVVVVKVRVPQVPPVPAHTSHLTVTPHTINTKEEEEEEEEEETDWAKARDDMEDCDVAGSQLTVLPQSSPWRVEWTGVEWSARCWSGV